MEEPGRLQSMRLLRVGHNWATSLSLFSFFPHFHFSLSCIGEGNGNPLLCSCLENPRDRGAWWASVYGVAQSRTQLTRLSSSSSSSQPLKLLLWFDVYYFYAYFQNSPIHVKWSESSSVVSDCLWPHGLYSPWNSPGQNTGVGSHSLLQGIFPTQGSNPGLLHCRWILYQLSHQGSPPSHTCMYP